MVGSNKNKKLIGFSTGFLWHVYPRASKAVIKVCKNMGCNAIELHCPVEEFHLMDELRQNDLKDFDFISFHLPSIRENFNILNRIQNFHNKLQFDAVVVHPSEVRNWNDLKSYDMPFSIENMDNNKKVGRTLKSMKEIMSSNDYGMTLDINHCYVNDPTLKLAEDLWNEFKDRISHFHLSGYKECHDPLVETNQTEFIDFVKNKNKPIIIESTCKDLHQAKKELNFIVDYLD